MIVVIMCGSIIWCLVELTWCSMIVSDERPSKMEGITCFLSLLGILPTLVVLPGVWYCWTLLLYIACFGTISFRSTSRPQRTFTSTDSHEQSSTILLVSLSLASVEHLIWQVVMRLRLDMVELHVGHITRWKADGEIHIAIENSHLDPLVLVAKGYGWCHSLAIV